jgi:hypothetical protein
MRRLAVLVPVALAGCLALASCSSGSPAGQAAGKAAGAPPTTQHASSDEDTPGKALPPETVVDGMHYVQLFNTVDPVLAQMTHDAVGGTVPAASQLQNVAGSLRQFAAQARNLPSADNDRRTIDHLAAASSTLAGQLDTLAAKGSKFSDAATLTAALSRFQSASAAARHAAGLPAVVSSSKPQPDTGP